MRTQGEGTFCHPRREASDLARTLALDFQLPELQEISLLFKPKKKERERNIGKILLEIWRLHLKVVKIGVKVGLGFWRSRERYCCFSLGILQKYLIFLKNSFVML